MNSSADSSFSIMGGVLMVAVGLLYLFFENSLLSSKTGQVPMVKHGISRTILGFQIGLIVLATVVTRSTVISLQAKRGLPKGNQVMGWAILGQYYHLCLTSNANYLLVISLCAPFLHKLQPNKHYLHRLVIIFLTFSPVFVILTISYEGLFYFVFCGFLVTWVRLEHHIYTFTTGQGASPPSPALKPKHLPTAIASIASQLTTADEKEHTEHYRALNLWDARISLFFLFLLQAAFFLTGNVASVSSFSMDSVYPTHTSL